MAEASRFAKSLRNPFQWLGAVLIIFVIVVIPIIGAKHERLSPHQSPGLQEVQAIGLAMYSYAQDHNGAYPVGKSSTEVFQKLIDGGYVTDPTIFFLELLKIPGKSKATSNSLKPENVCWDVTIPVDATSSDYLPLVFSTGYRVKYLPGGEAIPLFSDTDGRLAAIVVFYSGMNATWVMNENLSFGDLPNFINSNFDPKGKTYIQLTPDGPLSP